MAKIIDIITIIIIVRFTLNIRKISEVLVIMIGEMIAKIRKEKGITKTELANQTNINIGHLTHIEKGERNPSHKALKEICYALNVPYQQFLYAYEQELTNEQKEYNYLDHISFNKVPAISKRGSLTFNPALFQLLTE